MGDPRKPRKKYFGPRHPWEKARIESEKELKRDYGFKNKKELWKMSSLLKTFFDRAKKYVAKDTPQFKKEQEQLITKLNGLGLLKGDNSLDSILGIQLKDIIERRLQTVVFRKGLSRSVKQARQFITHGHITVNGKVITAPSYVVTLSEEATIAFSQYSLLSDETHPERSAEGIKSPETKKEEKAKKEKKYQNKSNKKYDYKKKSKSE
jgi:small subunit ribosomal protein S4